MRKFERLVGKVFVEVQRIFHVLVGLAFLFLAVLGVWVSFKLWGDYRRYPAQGLLSFSMVASFTVLLIIFGLYSFVKARSVR